MNRRDVELSPPISYQTLVNAATVISRNGK